MAIHIVTVGVFLIDATGNVIDKRKKTTTLQTAINGTSSEHRIIPDADIANSADYPTIKSYLELEEADGFLLQHMDQTYIVTRHA